MAGLHNQVTNRPTLVVDDKINDVADRSFAGLDGVAVKSLCALQMKIVACSLIRHKWRRRRSLGKTAPHPTFRPHPSMLDIVARLACADSIAGLFSICCRVRFTGRQSASWGR